MKAPRSFTQNPKHPTRPQMYLKLMKNALWYSKPMLLHMTLWTKRLRTATVNHCLTQIGHTLTKKRLPSAGLSPCTQTYVVLSLSGRYTNQGTIWCPVLKVRYTDECQVTVSCFYNMSISTSSSVPTTWPNQLGSSQRQTHLGIRVFPCNAGRENHNLAAFIPGEFSH